MTRRRDSRAAVPERSAAWYAHAIGFATECTPSQEDTGSMSMPPGTKPEVRSTRPGARLFAVAVPLPSILAVGMFGFLLGLSAAGPVAAVEPTMPPFTVGRHVYDYGNVLSTRSAAAAESLAAKIEAEGGGSVVVYTVDDASSIPDEATLVRDWHIDGMLVTAQDPFGEITIGSALNSRLGADGKAVVKHLSTPGPQTTESWIMSTLARVDAFASGTHVFDGVGILSASGRQQAETAAKDLGSRLGGTVYVDIAIGGTDPANAAFFNGAT